MTVFEIEECLDSMEILVDTREQPNAKFDKRVKSFGIPYKRCKLNYGDYAYNFKLPNGKYLFDISEPISADVVIERKMNLVELSTNFCEKQQSKHKVLNLRNRFEAEFYEASKNNASVYLLVESATWENLINGKYDTKFNPKAFLASITAFIARYDLKPIFCKPETSGKIIKEILFRELKERLNRGDYDVE